MFQLTFKRRKTKRFCKKTPKKYLLFYWLSDVRTNIGEESRICIHVRNSRHFNPFQKCNKGARALGNAFIHITSSLSNLFKCTVWISLECFVFCDSLSVSSPEGRHRFHCTHCICVEPNYLNLYINIILKCVDVMGSFAQSIEIWVWRISEPWINHPV